MIDPDTELEEQLDVLKDIGSRILAMMEKNKDNDKFQLHAVNVLAYVSQRVAGIIKVNIARDIEDDQAIQNYRHSNCVQCKWHTIANVRLSHRNEKS